MCCGDYFACVFASVWSIAQSIFHLCFCIWGSNLYECKYNISESGNLQYFWYLTYFYRNSCVTPDLENLHLPFYQNDNLFLTLRTVQNGASFDNCSKRKIQLDEDVLPGSNLSVTFPPEAALAERTYTIFRIFVVLDAIWLVTAAALLVGTCLRLRFCISTIFFFPWPILLFGILIFDGVVAGWYSLDISKTQGLSRWLKFIGATLDNEQDNHSKNFSKISTSIPSILLTCFFSRFILIWLVNLFLFFRVLQAGLNAVHDNFEMPKPQNKSPKTSFDLHSTDGSNSNSAAARIRRWQIYYGTTDDEDVEEERSKEVKRQRRKSRQRQSIEDSGWKKDDAFKYNQTLSVGVGGYDGDRSSSPSPLAANRSSGQESSRRPSRTSDCDNSGFHFPRSNFDTINETKCQRRWSYFPDRSDILKNRTCIVEDRQRQVTHTRVSSTCTVIQKRRRRVSAEVHFSK